MKNYYDKMIKPSLRHCNKINQICKPLKTYFDLSYFYYYTVTKEGRFGFFSNHIEWEECFFRESNLYLEYSYYLKPWNRLKGFSVSLMNQDKRFLSLNKVAKESFDIDYMIEFGTRVNDTIEYFGFASKRSDSNILQSYLNELPVLKVFVKQLREKNSNIFNDVKENCVDISSEIPAFYKPDASAADLSSSRSLLLQNLDLDLPQNLSKREREVSSLITKGYSAAEIALQLNLSKRTVESYIENLKDKLHSYSKAELIQRCLELQSINYI